MSQQPVPTKFGRYEVKERIGQGGMAVVYRAFDPNFESDVAIKVIALNLLNQDDFLRRFRQEALTLKQLHHSAIVPIQDFGQEGGWHYYVMRYMPSGSLRDRLQDGPLPLEAVVKIAERIGPALDEAHRLGIIHRDIKPANILVDEEGRSYLSDFGIARNDDLTQNQTATLIGTAQYMAPEQVRGGEIGPKTDLYQWGVTLFQLLTGEIPYGGATPIQTAFKHVHDPIPNARDMNPLLPEQIQTYIDRIMAKNPAERFGSATAMATALAVIAREAAPAPVKESKTEVKASVPKRTFSPPPPKNPVDGESSVVGATPSDQKQPKMLMWVGMGAVAILAAIGVWFGFIRDDGAVDADPTATPAQVEASANTTEDPTEAPEPTDEPPTPEPEAPAVSLDTLANSVVRLEAIAGFQIGDNAPDNASVDGTAFIFDELGFALTTNSAVAGSGILEVYLPNESSPRNARVLGTSECANLAVIDIDGEGFPEVAWHEDEVNTGMDIFVAGYSEGDYTLTSGIVSRESADGRTATTSIEELIQHDATVNFDAVGGPLITADGRVIGINIGSTDGSSLASAIPYGSVVELVAELRRGNDVDSIGVVGVAIGDDPDTAGIFVLDVISGSPADNVGLLGGDIIRTVENIGVGLDGTLGDYCSILRSNNADDVLAVEVLRLSTGELLEGRINGAPLEVVSTAIAEPTAVVDTATSAGVAGNYLIDDTGLIEVLVPEEWTDAHTGSWFIDDIEQGPSIFASADLEAYFGGFSEPGLFIGVRNLGRDELFEDLVELDFEAFDARCEFIAREVLDDGFSLGNIDLYENCDGQQNALFTITALSESGRKIIFIHIRLPDLSDESVALSSDLFDNLIINE